MEVYNKKTNIKSSCIYSHWIHEIVNKGVVDDYSILKYPDIVKLVMIDANQKTIKEKIIDRTFAESKLKESPHQYRIAEIDVKKQIQKDILKSKKLKNQSSLSFLKFGNTNLKDNIIAIIRAIKILNPIWKFMIAIIIAGLGGFLAYILIDLYNSNK